MLFVINSEAKRLCQLPEGYCTFFIVVFLVILRLCHHNLQLVLIFTALSLRYISCLHCIVGQYCTAPAHSKMKHFLVCTGTLDRFCSWRSSYLSQGIAFSLCNSCMMSAVAQEELCQVNNLDNVIWVISAWAWRLEEKFNRKPLLLSASKEFKRV